MKLLFVHERFGALAGAEANILHTAAELQRRGHGVGILHGPGTGKGETAWRDVFSERFSLPERGSRPDIAGALGVFRPDVIYVHKLADLPVLAALLAADTPLVRMVHDHDLYCMRGYKYHYLSRKICTRAASPFCVFPCGASVARNPGHGFGLRWVSYHAKREEIRLNQRFDRLVVGSAYMKKELLRNGFDRARIEIHPPVPKHEDQALPGTFSDRNLIVYAGQVIRGKGVDLLLKALAQVPVRFECLIFGEGNHRAYCEKLCRRLGLGDRVHFKGFVPQDELKGHYRDASVAVMSSVWPEPFGAAGLEAMRHGLPVVAFDAGGVKEWLLDGCNGFLVPWMDCSLFASRVESLLRDKGLARRMGERGRERLEREFGFGHYITNLENLFERVVGDTPLQLTA